MDVYILRCLFFIHVSMNEYMCLCVVVRLYYTNDTYVRDGCCDGGVSVSTPRSSHASLLNAY